MMRRDGSAAILVDLESAANYFGEVETCLDANSHSASIDIQAHRSYNSIHSLLVSLGCTPSQESLQPTWDAWAESLSHFSSTDIDNLKIVCGMCPTAWQAWSQSILPGKVDISSVGTGCSQVFSLGPDVSVTFMTINTIGRDDPDCRDDPLATPSGSFHGLQKRCSKSGGGHVWWYWALACQKSDHQCKLYALRASFDGKSGESKSIYKDQAAVCHGSKVFFYSWTQGSESQPLLHKDVFDFSCVKDTHILDLDSFDTMWQKNECQSGDRVSRNEEWGPHSSGKVTLNVDSTVVNCEGASNDKCLPKFKDSVVLQNEHYLLTEKVDGAGTGPRIFYIKTNVADGTSRFMRDEELIHSSTANRMDNYVELSNGFAAVDEAGDTYMWDFTKPLIVEGTSDFTRIEHATCKTQENSIVHPSKETLTNCASRAYGAGVDVWEFFQGKCVLHLSVVKPQDCYPPQSAMGSLLFTRNNHAVPFFGECADAYGTVVDTDECVKAHDRLELQKLGNGKRLVIKEEADLLAMSSPLVQHRQKKCIVWETSGGWRNFKKD